jgi:hypothetical protein
MKGTEMSSSFDESVGSQAFEGDASDYHAMALVAELLVTLSNENQNNKYKNEKQQYTNMEFVDKKTGEVMTQRVLL